MLMRNLYFYKFIGVGHSKSKTYVCEKCLFGSVKREESEDGADVWHTIADISLIPQLVQICKNMRHTE